MRNHAKTEATEEEADPEVCFHNMMMLLQREGEGTEREEGEGTSLAQPALSFFSLLLASHYLSAWNRLSA